jgi:hypothetical protein
MATATEVALAPAARHTKADRGGRGAGYGNAGNDGHLGDGGMCGSRCVPSDYGYCGGGAGGGGARGSSYAEPSAKNVRTWSGWNKLRNARFVVIDW